MKPSFPVLCLFLTFLAALPALRAADDAKVALQPGIRLLEIELVPSRVTLRTAKCDPLVIAVSKTTLAHPSDALSILHAALTRGMVRDAKDGKAVVDVSLPCPCARRIFLASVAAAPKRASDILDLAALLYPDCTSEFADALKEYDARGQAALNFTEPAGDSTSDGGFGVGFGPGFPGSPGFTGSAPSGINVLPPRALTSVVNG